MQDLTLSLAWLDWLLIAAYLLISLWIGVANMRRGTESLSDYFVAGRKLGWFAVGTSLVATTFAADTPLAVSGLTRRLGFQGNWFWWDSGIAFLFCMTFFAPLWRRARIMTDTELIELRYSGLPARILRMVLSLHKSCLVNTITMGWVILAMSKIVSEAFGWPKEQAIPVMMIIAVFYTVISGLWGVVMTDIFQFVLSLAGAYILMLLVIFHLGGPAELTQQVIAAAGAAQSSNPASVIAAPDQIMRFFPTWDAGRLAWFTLLFYLLIRWWNGAEGQGYIAQRLFSARSERHAVFAMLWFVFLHLVVRGWPWIIVGLGSIVVFPNLVDPETAYPRMIVTFMPIGLKGLMIASLMAAFQSTISTHLNWGSSYLMNDIYKRYIKRQASDRHYVLVSQAFVVLMAIFGSLAAWQMDSIVGGWFLVTELAAGGVVASLLRWYWWRVNAWAEITGIIGSVICSLTLRNMDWIGVQATWLGFTQLGAWFTSLDFLGTSEFYFARFTLIIVINTALWLTVTLLTRPVAMDTLAAFYRRTQPGGFWGPVMRGHADLKPAATSLIHQVLTFGVGVVALYLALFSLGWLMTGQYALGALSLLGAITLGFLLVHLLQRVFKAANSLEEETPGDKA